MTARFQQTIASVARELPGAFAVCAQRLDDDRHDRHDRLAWNEDAILPAASVIKIAVALEVLCAVAEGSIDPDLTLELRDGDKVNGSGVLAALGPGVRLTLNDLLYLALAISDNTAANRLIELATVDAVNARLERLGLEKTRLLGTIFGGGGESSPTTAAELVRLLRVVHAREGLPIVACDRLLALLVRTQTASTIGRGLPDSRFAGVTGPPITLAYKTGSMVGVVAEAAIVTAPAATYAIAVLSEGSGDLRPNHDNIGRVQLAEISRAVYEAFTVSSPVTHPG